MLEVELLVFSLKQLFLTLKIQSQDWKESSINVAQPLTNRNVMPPPAILELVSYLHFQSWRAHSIKKKKKRQVITSQDNLASNLSSAPY